MTETKAKDMKIALLGAPRIELGSHPVALPRRRTRSLLYFLAATPGEHSREALVELLWPRLDAARGKRQLSDALSDLRRTFGTSAIDSDTERVAWTGAKADAVVFRNRLDEAARRTGPEAERHLSAALDLYGGEFLAGVRVDGSESFEEWLEEQRLHLSSAALSAAVRLATLRMEAGDAAQAIEVAMRGLDLDDLREDLWRILIRARADLGDQAGALEEYSRCKETLHRELGVAPEPETEALKRRVSAERGTAGAGIAESAAAKVRPPLPFSLRLPGGSLTLVGRERELGSLLRAWDSATSGIGGLAAIEGEPGIGKSRLAAEFAARAAGAGAVVLGARCPDLGDPPPYGPIEEAIRGVLPNMSSGAFSRLGNEWFPWVGRLLPELGLGVEAPEPRSPEEEKARLAEAAGRVLEVIAADRPLLLIVEDIHWAHPATVLLLHTVARRGRPMLVLTTMRDTEPQTGGTQAMRRAMADLEKEGLATTVSLGPLRASDTEALVKLAINSSGVASKANAGAVAKLAEGQPLFALELTRAVLESPDDPDLPASLTNAITSRIDRASDFARKVLELAAVFGRPVTPQLLARAAGVEPTDEALVNAGEELVARRLLQEEPGGEMTLTHGLVRAAVYKSLSVSRRRALHSRAASALESGAELPAGVRNEALARHYRLAGDLSLAAEHLIAAGERANGLGELTTADARYRSAAELLQRLGRDREAAEALERAGMCVWRSCDVDAASAAINEALAIWKRVSDNKDAVTRLQTRLADLYTRWGYFASDPEEVRRHVRAAIELTEGMTGELRAYALAARALVRTMDGDSAGAKEDALASLRLSEAVPGPWLAAKDALAWVDLFGFNRLESALEHLLDKTAVADREQNALESHTSHGDICLIYLKLRDPIAAEEHARASLQAAEGAGLAVKVSHGRFFVAFALVYQGRYEEAAELLEPLLRDPLTQTERPYLVAAERFVMAEICARRGDMARARRLVRMSENAPRLDTAALGLYREALERARDAIRQASLRKKAGVA